MTILLCEQDSILKSKIQSVFKTPLLNHLYTENLDAKDQEIIIIIDQDLLPFQQEILNIIRQSIYVVGVWSNHASSNYLPKILEDLLDSIICEENISQLYSMADSSRKCNSIKTSHNFTGCKPSQ